MRLTDLFKKAAAVAACALFAFPALACGNDGPSPDLPPHLISTPDASPRRPIDEREEQALSALSALDREGYRARVDELYAVVVYDGKKPVFCDNDPVRKVYDEARAVLDGFILNEWHDGAQGEFEIVHAIHDWLVAYVEYDFELYGSVGGDGSLTDDAAFFIDGVFLERRAVCDGIAQAFCFLCAIEGIESVRVTGAYASSPHAWNKVRLGGDWYNLDATADAAYYTVGGELKKQISHGYMLLSDAAVSRFVPQSHIFTEGPCLADKDFDYFEGRTVRVGGTTFSATVKSESELNAIFAAVNDCDGAVGKLELKLDFANKTQVNSADMYFSEIYAAYELLDDPDFVFSGASHPYFRYPNGVYVFLMYI